MLTPDTYRALSAMALEKTSEGLLCLDTDGRILFANEAAARTLGATAAALCDKTIFQVAPEMVVALWKELWKELRTHGTFAFEFQLSGANDRVVQVDMAAHRLGADGKDLACVFFHDVEERKRLQNLQQEFVSNVSHELRTPMTVIREGISQVLEGLRGDINDAQNRALSLALSGIERMGRIINDLLDMSKIESGRITLKRERVDINALVREVSGAFQSLADDRGIELRLSIPAGSLTVYGDHDRLMQVLTNLIGNSFKYTEKGHITLTVTARDTDILCSVSDSGIGISAEDKEKIFAKFEQGERASLTGEKGTGLGLSISRAIVELHRGRIWADSPGPGQGAQMSLTLPRQKGRDIFCDQLALVLHTVARRGGSLSVLSFQLQPVAGATPDASRYATLLTSLEQLVRRESGRMSDLLVVDERGLYLALESTVKREAARLSELMLSAARNEMGAALSDFSLTCKIYSFPEDRPLEGPFLTFVAGDKS